MEEKIQLVAEMNEKRARSASTECVLYMSYMSSSFSATSLVKFFPAFQVGSVWEFAKMVTRGMT